MGILAEVGQFIREFRRTFQTTGALLPSSRFLARAMVAPLRRPRGPARILEVGPGTGAVTREIARHLQPGDWLDAVEINPVFVRHLHRQLDEDPRYAHCRDQVRLIEGAVEELPGQSVYDFVVSGLPLNNFPVLQVREVFRTFQRLLKPGGTLSYYEYVLVRQLKSPFVNRQERRRLFRVGRVVSRYIRNYQIGRQRVLANVPPAMVRHLRFCEAIVTV